jgi:hypothetical protein
MAEIHVMDLSFIVQNLFFDFAMLCEFFEISYQILHLGNKIFVAVVLKIFTAVQRKS